MRRRMVLGLAVVAAGTVIVGIAWASRQGGAGGFFSWGDPARALAQQAAQAAAKGAWPQAAAVGARYLAEHPQGAQLDQVLCALADAYAHQHRLIDARQAYQRVVSERPDSPLVAQAQERLGQLNIQVLFSPVVTPSDVDYDVQPGDTLTKIANQFHTTIELLERANHLANQTLRPQMHLKVARADFSVIVDKSQNTLTLKNGEQVLKVYHVATGKENSTPVGTFRITSRIPNPPWFTPQGVIPFGDPRNILGTRWLGFDKPGYGIHGTSDPSSIGRQATAGCVRLTNGDAEELYTLLPLGTTVIILD